MRGRYRILLGMAAGVGKTYRMLQEGRQAKADGRDVVIGYLEPHDRPETAALAEELEAVLRRRFEHGGLVLEELDVDAVVRRRTGSDDDRHLPPDRPVKPLGQLGGGASGDLLEALRQLPAHGDGTGRVDSGKGLE